MANSTALPRILQARRAGCAVLVALSVMAAASEASAQALRFGSADDPAEQIQEVWWRRDSHFYALGGVSLIAAQWRGAGGLGLDLVRRAFTARLGTTFRAGYYGAYEADFDEPYDLLRLIDFARYNPPQTDPVHLRIGPVERMQLGTGHLVHFFGSSIAWDDRTVGLETTYRGRTLDLAGFTDNLLLDGVVGGRAALRPLAGTRDPRMRSLQFGFNYVTDRADRPAEKRRLEGYNVDAQLDLFQSGDTAFSPFVSYAWYPGFGDGVSLGAAIHSESFLDLLSFRFRMALFYNDEGFIPGYVGSFYTVSNPLARILDSDADLSDPETESLEGIALEQSLGYNDLLTELHLKIDSSFELWYAFRRHFGVQRLSELHLRLFLRTAERLRLEIGLDRGGLKSFFTIFNDLDDQSALVFGTDYRLSGPLFLYLRARYSYERVDADDDNAQRFLVQRRFEPMTGLRLRL